jgi:hypothetical protein
LAAQIPDQPQPPLTAINGENVDVTWDLPDFRGSPITAYQIKFRESDLVTYTEYLPTCDGSLEEIYTTRTCSIPIAVLRASPYNFAWGSSIYARLSASNIYGTSIMSEEDNGAIILTVPDIPINLANVVELTLANQIGVSWEEAVNNGGTPVIDFTLWTDQGQDVFMPHDSGLTVTQTVVTNLDVGTYY